jgi:molybdate transport system ATP-binding protein
MTAGVTTSFTKRFPGGAVICVENLQTANQPGITVLFGPSGSGKTTVLRCLAGLEKPDAGTIGFADELWVDTARGIFLEPQRRHVGFVPQDFALFPHLSVEQNIRYGLSALPRTIRQKRVTETLQWLGLDGLEKRRPRELSGGQQQRVALARAVARRPRLLLLDEPLAALDTPTRLRLRGDLRKLLSELGIPALLVTHDRLEALSLGDELVVMDTGRILQHGPVHEVFSHPANLAVADIVAVETVQPGRVIVIKDGLVKVAVGSATLTATALGLSQEVSTVYVCIRAEDVVLFKGEEGHSSPRNRLPARVRALDAEGPMVRIDLDCGFPLMALLTKQACEEMDLRLDDAVLALIKAPNIHLIPRLN